MFWLLLCLLCLGLLNWGLVLVVILIVLMITTPLLAAILASVGFIMFSVYMLNKASHIEPHYVGEIVLVQTMQYGDCECEIIAIDNTSPFKYHVKRKFDGYLFCVKNVYNVEEECV
jgi:hypothetical protein